MCCDSAIGAGARLKELVAEMEAVRRAFPDIQQTGEIPLPRVETLKANGQGTTKA
jgi:hypothetical protein